MSKRIGWVALVVLGSGLGGFANLLIFSHLVKPAVAQSFGPPATGASVVTDLVAIGDRFEVIARQVSPAVVYVEARKPAPVRPGGNKTAVEESGSGVIVRLDGRRDYLVLTNHHVIADADANRIIVQLADGRVLTPTRVWSHPDTDVAILSIEGSGGLPTAVLGDSDKIRIGNWVLAIGSPFGLNQTVTHGILSAKERGRINLGESIHIKDFLQTDAAINPGSSGGPLVNLNGEIVGINTAIASPNGSSSGVSFSIPINQFKRVMMQLLERGAVSRGYLGIQLSHTFEAADALRLGLDRAHGALVEVVFPNTPAARAGLRVGDVILQVDQTLIRNENHLINTISETPIGRTVVLGIWRNGQRLTVNAVVEDRTQGQSRPQ